MTSSRRASTAWTSSDPVIASAAPGTRRASASASYGPQQGLRRHAGPERALAADQAVLDDRDLRPSSASRPAATSPAGPAPITTTSKVASTLPRPRPYNGRRTYPWGRHGFDVVGSRGRLRVEVPEAS